MKSYKKDLINALSETSPSITKQNLGLLVDSVLDAIDHLTSKEGQTLTLRDFGTFKCTLRAARTARNPQNGEPVQVAEKLVRSFKASSPIALSGEEV
jgi:DNA-binding protein HU-beta